MELTRRKRVTARDVSKRSINVHGEPCHDVQLYIVPPTSTIQLAELYDLVVERLKVLRILEQTLPRVPSKNLDDKKSAVLHELKKQGLKTYAKLLISPGHGSSEAAIKERMDDHVSHFFLRLAHCQSENLRSWFAARELELFRLRFHSLSMEGVRSFLEAYQLKYSPIPPEEKKSIMDELVISTANATSAYVEVTDFYKVPFTEVLDLIPNRRVFLSKGFAYVPNRDLLSVMCTIFRNNLRQGLLLAAGSLAFLEEDERLKPILNLHNVDFGEVYKPPAIEGTITAADLDQLSRVSFPPCMRQLHESVRKTHHAKHGTRMQYGLFLKAIGVPLNEAVTFWRTEFLKTMTPEKFQSHYLYNIRHNYGQEGKRTSYSAYSCKKIINSSVGTGDCHGCPFKHSSATVLKQQLESYGIPVLGVQSIMEFVQQKQFELACTKYFEITHPNNPVEVIYHPNQFFELSQKILTGREVPSRRNFESKGRPQRDQTEQDTSSITKTEVKTGKANQSANESLWDSMDLDISNLIQEAEEAEKQSSMSVDN